MVEAVESAEFRCPFCRSTFPPIQESKTSFVGWYVSIVLLSVSLALFISCFGILIFWVPLCFAWMPLVFLRDHWSKCNSCGIKLD